MSAVKSVQLAIVVATQRRDQAERVLVHARRAFLFAQDQMAQLASYAAETELKWSIAAQESTTPELLRHHGQFMERLHHAIGLQTNVIADAERRLELEKNHLLAAEFRLAGLGQILKNKQALLNQLQSRRDQKQMDEFAAQRGNQSLGGIISGEIS